MGFVHSLSLLLFIISTIKGYVFLLDHKEALHDPGADNATSNPDQVSILEEPTDPFLSNIRSTTHQSIKLKKRCISPVPKCTNLTSCLGRCTVDRQFHDINGSIDKPACYCDPECNTVFSDCCADYADHCNVRRFVRKKKWQCFEIDDFPFDIWMIGKCKAKWPIDDVFKKCTNFSKVFYKVSGLTPVIDKNKNIYRNRYCAQCNGVRNFTQWKVIIRCERQPPKKYSKLEKLQHRDKYCDPKTISFKNEKRAIRYCYNVRNKCKYKGNNETVVNCRKRRTGLVSLNSRTYRNFDCLLCNQEPGGRSASTAASCGPSWNARDIGEPMYDDMKSSLVTSFAVALEIPVVIYIRRPRCPKDYLYDNVVGRCRKLTFRNQLTLDSLKRFAIRLEYEQTDNHTCLDDNLTMQHNGILASYTRRKFSVLFKEKLFTNTNDDHDWRLSDFNIHVHRNTSCLVTFQILGTRKNNKTWTIKTNSSFPLDYSKINPVFVQFEHQDGKYAVCKYSLFHTITKEMSCVGNVTYEVSQNELNTGKGNIFINATQKEYRYGDYQVYKHNNETRIAICRDFKPSNCLYYLDIKNNTHWKSFPNKTLYIHVTNTWFDYGEYSIINGTLWLCLTKDFLTNKANKIDFIIPSSIHVAILSYVTLVSFTISIVSLSVLLTVYSLFPTLRNLPGKNLMLLCGVLAIGQLLWLLQKKVYSWSADMCIALSLALHYFLLSSFSCSNSIALHSFLTFRALTKGKLRQRLRGRAFLWYGMYSLGFPFVIVAVCWLLDHYQVVSIGYASGHGHCWFGSKRGLYIAFVSPVFTLIFVNIILFLAALRVIYKCTKASQKLAGENGGPNKKHVGIYLRMSAMMGFTWIFGLLQLIFPRSLTFQYLFVIVNGLQGFYLAGAFLFTDNIKKVLSRKSVIERGSSSSRTRHNTTKI